MLYSLTYTHVDRPSQTLFLILNNNKNRYREMWNSNFLKSFQKKKKNVIS